MSSAALNFKIMGLFDGIFGMFQAGLEYDMNRALQRQQFGYNRRLAKEAYDRQVQFYNLQNEYNDPKNVVQRYKDAGLNPYSAFGTSGSYQPAQQSASVPEGSGVGLPSVRANFGSIPDPLSIRRQLAEIENIEANTRKTEGDTLDPEQTKYGQELSNKAKELGLINQEQQIRITDLNRQFLEDTLPIRKEQEQQKLDNMAQQYNQMAADIALKASQENLNKEQARVACEQVGKLIAETALLKTQNEWYGRISSKQIEQMDAQIKLWANQMSLNDSIKFLNSAKEWNVMADTESKKLDNWGKKLRNDLDQFTYGANADGEANVGGMLWKAIQNVADLLPFK